MLITHRLWRVSGSFACRDPKNCPQLPDCASMFSCIIVTIAHNQNWWQKRFICYSKLFLMRTSSLNMSYKNIAKNSQQKYASMLGQWLCNRTRVGTEACLCLRLVSTRLSLSPDAAVVASFKRWRHLLQLLWCGAAVNSILNVVRINFYIFARDCPHRLADTTVKLVLNVTRACVIETT